jgi:hypothetical protein
LIVLERAQARHGASLRTGGTIACIRLAGLRLIEACRQLRLQKFVTAIIERYRRRESSVEEVLIEISLAGVSVRR